MKSFVKHLIVQVCGLALLTGCWWPRGGSGSLQADQTVHQAHLAGNWYSANKEELIGELNSYFDFAKKHFGVVVDPKQIKAIIVPHAGYYYSGLCAAATYRTLLGADGEKNKTIKKVIVLAPTHVHHFSGIALPDYDSYQTSLGQIHIDYEAIEKLEDNEFFDVIPEAHSPEHAVEIQLPFLQMVLADFTLVPLVVGEMNSEDFDSVCQSLAAIIDSTTLVVISSDFMHFGSSYGYQPFTKDILYNIRRFDSLAVQAIQQQTCAAFVDVLRKTQTTICGRDAIAILLKMIEAGALGKNLDSRLACYYTSAQLTQARRGAGQPIDVRPLFESVADNLAQTSVSYVGLLFTQETVANLPPKDQFTDFEKRALVGFARDVITNSLAETEKCDEQLLFPVISNRLQQPCATFVTLTKLNGELRGCIGSIVTDQPIVVNVAANAKNAAFSDPRFSPLIKSELPTIKLEVTVLTQPNPVAGYADIVLGKHGIILKKGMNQAVFLPQVPGEFGWTKEETLAHLSAKAGLPQDAWRSGCQFDVFEGFEIKE